ncbi:MAG: hypothetical protein QG673_282 [Pseudomonadota bacterium]|nr:hypothetical protein [Pseudomonadota bacterium]
MKQIINASDWPSIIVGQQQIFSPNSNILTQLTLNPSTEFWTTTFSEFACVIINIIAFEKNFTPKKILFESIGDVQAIRDHFGLEPFFYYNDQDKFIFASNLPSIIKCLGYTPPLNYTQIHNMLTNCCIPSATYSDETNYIDIFRVEPGCILTFSPNNILVHKKRYWTLDGGSNFNNYNNVILYPKLEDYLEHFNHLLLEGIQLQCMGAKAVAAEFSGGLDSSTVLTGIQQLNLIPDLFMHTAPPNSSEIDDSNYAKIVIDYYKIQNINFVGAQDFNLLDTIKANSQLFAGTPSYIFPICANNIHQAVADSKHTILFSGFGGDECVSNHVPISIFLRELLDNNRPVKAWQELYMHYVVSQQPNLIPSTIKRILTILKNCHPFATQLTLSIKQKYLNSLIKKFAPHKPETFSLFNALNYRTISELEYQQLQGSISHHIRHRVEESAIVAKHYGFSYKYPLLYPPLVEFYHRLPLFLKRDLGVNRLLIRNHLAKYLPQEVYQKHQKIGGIMPATMNRIKQEYNQNYYTAEFTNLPYEKQAAQIRQKYSNNLHTILTQNILLYGLKNFKRG